MDIYKCTIVDIAYYENEKQVIVNVDIQDDIIEMSCEVNGICFSSSGEYYFDTFQSLRDRLLELGYGIKCNGSRINAIQSGMRGYSENIYLVEIGKQALNKDIFRIWDYADIKDFPSTDEQKIYANKWYKSLDPSVVIDKNIITSFCPETAPLVAISLLEMLVGKEKAEIVATAMGFQLAKL